MKRIKTLMAALAVLIMSTAATVTGTVAWFSANKTVSVSNMKITAKSDATDLQITTYGKWSATDWARDLNDLNFDKSVYPVAHDTIDADTVTDNAKWYYGYSDDEAVATMNTETKTYLNNTEVAAEFTDYVVSQDFYFRVKRASDSYMKDLHVKSIDLPDNTGITCIAVGADGMQEFAADGNGSTPLISAVDYVADGVASTYKVSLYFYIDGNNANVTTIDFYSDPMKLTGATKVTFEATQTRE